MTVSDNTQVLPEKLKRPGALQLLVIFSVYFLIIAIPLLIALRESWDTEGGFRAMARPLGLAAGFIGLAMLCLQPWFTSRLRCLDRFWGLDKCTRLHKRFAVVALSLLLLHPLLLSYSYGSWDLFSFDTGLAVGLGKLTLLTLIAVVGFALGFKLLRLNYQAWRFFHKAAIFLIPLALAHGLLIGLDGLVPSVWVSILALFAVGIFLYRTIFVPLFHRKHFQVQSVEPASKHTHTLRMVPEEGSEFNYHPGQFMFLRLKRPGRRTEEHPFTIASSPTLDGAIEATIKESGDFTNTIGETRPGDSASIEAPFGKFSFLYDQPPRFLFIAGGVGLTPIMSMLRFLRDTRDTRPAFLLYGCRTESEIVLRKELESMPAHVRMQIVLSKPGANWVGATGLVDKDTIESLVPREFLGEETHIYLCGPPAMMQLVRKALGQLGIHKDRVHYEYFSL